jgi:hypothetical protein
LSQRVSPVASFQKYGFPLDASVTSFQLKSNLLSFFLREERGIEKPDANPVALQETRHMVAAVLAFIVTTGEIIASHRARRDVKVKSKLLRMYNL